MFPEKFYTAALPEELKAMVKPLVETVEQLSEKLKELDEWVNSAAKSYPEIERLRQIDGVGPLTALAFILCIEDPKRFSTSRNVAAFLGLRPRLRQSSDNARMGRISKEGDSDLRRLLVQCAHSTLRSKRPSELQSWGLALVERKGKKKAVVALARKLAVLMHRLWQSGANYDRLFEYHRRQRLAEQRQQRASKKFPADGTGVRRSRIPAGGQKPEPARRTCGGRATSEERR